MTVRAVGCGGGDCETNGGNDHDRSVTNNKIKGDESVINVCYATRSNSVALTLDAVAGGGAAAAVAIRRQLLGLPGCLTQRFGITIRG